MGLYGVSYDHGFTTGLTRVLNIGALFIRISFRGILYCNYNKELPAIVE